MNKKILRTLTVLCAALMLTGGFSVTAFAQTGGGYHLHGFRDLLDIGDGFYAPFYITRTFQSDHPSTVSDFSSVSLCAL